MYKLNYFNFKNKQNKYLLTNDVGEYIFLEKEGLWEKENWKMKMNEPIAIKKLTREEAQKILDERRREKKHL